MGKKDDMPDLEGLRNDQRVEGAALGGEITSDLGGVIGTTAGRIYTELSKANSPKELEELKRLVNSNEVKYHMAIGWLARENKIGIDKVKGVTMVELRG